MKEIKTKIKLPSEVSVHIPALSDIDLEQVMDIISKDGVKLVQNTIADKVLEKFVEENEDFINEMVEKVMDEHQEELRDSIKNELKN